MSLEIKDFITGLRDRMRFYQVPQEQQESITEAVLAEYEAVPGPIREIAWAVLVERGYIGLAEQITSPS